MNSLSLQHVIVTELVDGRYNRWKKNQKISDSSVVTVSHKTDHRVAEAPSHVGYVQVCAAQ